MHFAFAYQKNVFLGVCFIFFICFDRMDDLGLFGRVQTQTFASSEINARRWRSVVTKYGLLHAACSALPEPWRIVHDLDFLAGKQLVACGLGHRVLVPHLEMNEHFVVGLAAIVGLGNHVNAVHCTDVQLLNDVIYVFAGRAFAGRAFAGRAFAGRTFEHARNADAGL